MRKQVKTNAKAKAFRRKAIAQCPKMLRKQKRKQARLDKKAKKHAYYTHQQIKVVSEDKKSDQPPLPVATKSKDEIKDVKKKKKRKLEGRPNFEFQKRNLLLEENEREEKYIKTLEKQLKLHRRKSKSIPQSFLNDGLDYLLEACDPSKIPNLRDPEFLKGDEDDDDRDFDDDYTIAIGQKQFSSQNKGKSQTSIPVERNNETDEVTSNEKKVKKKVKFNLPSSDSEETDDHSDDDPYNYRQESSSESDIEDSDENVGSASDEHDTSDGSDANEDSWDGQQETVSHSDEEDSDEDIGLASDENDNDDDDSTVGDYQSEEDDDVGTLEETLKNETKHQTTTKMDNNAKKAKTDEYWEDIYGRLRDRQGNVIERKTNSSGCYVPPALRKVENNDDPKKAEVFQKLKRQLKGLLNRLSESNIKPIASQIEDLYMKNARSDMNDALTQLMMDAVVNVVATPERLIQEHALLIALLHANIGSEIGAHFLEVSVDKLKAFREQGENYGEGKQCDNLLHLILHMYSFKIVNSLLIYDLLNLFAETFSEKDIDLILLVLRSVGFILRKDDPISLKNIVIKLQSVATCVNVQEKSRAKFMLDTLMAVRNNNMHKIPNYDPSHVEHLKKLLRSLIRKGNAVGELKISLADLFNAESRGRWWVVGSAWTGQSVEEADTKSESKAILPSIANVEEKILKLARQLRMNTDARKAIFCIIMTADDYVDAFEKILRLALTGQQETDIVNVIIECCLREKVFNPYYAFLLGRFCNKDRKYKLMIQFAVWDKIKLLNDAAEFQSSNLAHLLAHLFLTSSMAISILKVIEFSKMDKVLVRFLRQLLLIILLHDSEKDIRTVFSVVLKSLKLHALKEGLVLFMHHFMLKNKDKLPLDAHEKLESRIELVDKILNKL